ncbi:hypothetical protein PN498_02635 [Oscillatoria sp. CS-180]|uniref:hypothetical protein n=1 Tax=Oscillatoria sp. CS-180 TaxID=3021720 RepID=UPI00232BFFC7|nr:hypothetical protein [Oscillatoria sp. CS-180]MDB9524872.1 hypothetical protein [Oscillatoria sp. CS-180]
MTPAKPLLAVLVGLGICWPQTVDALPPPEEVPEEVLRTEIILEARSPLTGEPLTATEYAQLQEALRENTDPLLSSQVREAIFLLQIRRVLKPVVPILP